MEIEDKCHFCGKPAPNWPGGCVPMCDECLDNAEEKLKTKFFESASGDGTGKSNDKDCSKDWLYIPEEWKEIDEKFDDLCQILFDASDSCSCSFCKEHKFYITIEDMKRIKDFFHSEVENIRQETIKAINSCITPEDYESPEGASQALSNIEHKLLVLSTINKNTNGTRT